MSEKVAIHPLAKAVLELGPLALFVLANWRWGVFTGTAVFVAAAVVAFVASYVLTRHIPVMGLVSVLIVVVFGGLTVVLQNEVFIKIKPTIIYALFSTTLLYGLAIDKPLLAYVFDSAFKLTAEGWRKLTLRWALYFVGMAVLNEIVWRTQSFDFWLNFKFFVVMPLTFVFAALQYPLVTKYSASPQPSPSGENR